MKKITLLMTSLLMLILAGCAKPQIVRIFPPEEVAKMEINKILENKDLSTEEKSQLIQMKMSEDIERKKRAVEAEKDNKLSSIINKPVTPLRTPDTILRVLILPYEDDQGVLNGWKYSYVKVDDGKWIMADYINGTKPSMKKTLTPLQTGDEKRVSSGEMAPALNNDDVKYTVKKSANLSIKDQDAAQTNKKSIQEKEYNTLKKATVKVEDKKDTAEQSKKAVNKITEKQEKEPLKEKAAKEDKTVIDKDNKKDNTEQDKEKNIDLDKNQIEKNQVSAAEQDKAGNDNPVDKTEHLADKSVEKDAENKDIIATDTKAVPEKAEQEKEDIKEQSTNNHESDAEEDKTQQDIKADKSSELNKIIVLDDSKNNINK